MLATFTSADRGRLQLSLRDSGAVPCFARHCQTTSGSANEVSWEGIKSGGRACQRRDQGKNKINYDVKHIYVKQITQ